MLEERLEELLSLSIGEIREILAYEDAEDTLEKFLNENGWIETDDNHDDDYEEDYDEDDDWDFDEDDEEEDYSSKPGDEELPSQEEESLAVSIAADIDDGKYNISTIVGLYSQDIIDRVKYLIG